MADANKPNNPFDLSAGVPAVEGALRPKPKFADRVSPRIVAVGMGLAAFMLGIFIWSLDAMDQRKRERKERGEMQAAAQTKPAETVVPKDLIEGNNSDPSSPTPRSSLVSASSSAPDPMQDLLGRGGSASLTGNLGGQPAGKSDVPPLTGPGPTHLGSGRALDNGLGDGDMRADGAGQTVRVLTPEQQLANQAKLERMKRQEQARQAGLVATPYAADDRRPVGGLGDGLPASATAMLASLAGQGGAAPAGHLLPTAQQRAPETDQDQKLQFLKNAGKDGSSYLQHSPMPAVSRDEVKRGSYIPLRLEVAINSDQPGLINARTTEDIWDTVTGCRLLIPALTLVQGVYDSKVAVGQTRNLAVWNYMRFEDGSDLNLGGMQGYDSSGAAGIAADVDNHYFKLFGLAFGMSMITAGVQQSVTQPPPNATGMTTQQAVATALAQQYGQLGSQIITRHMQIQPTLRNYPGERFIIMTPATIVFKKVWRKRC